MSYGQIDHRDHKTPCLSLVSSTLVPRTLIVGQAFQDKIALIRSSLKEKKTWGFIVNTLDEIAWIFNLRGSDIQFNPVFFAYAIITQEAAYLYVENDKLDDKVKSHLESVTLKPYCDVFTDLAHLSAENSSVTLDS